jgi:hypothetical protein
MRTVSCRRSDQRKAAPTPLNTSDRIPRVYSPTRPPNMAASHKKYRELGR